MDGSRASKPGLAAHARARRKKQKYDKNNQGSILHGQGKNKRSLNIHFLVLFLLGER